MEDVLAQLERHHLSFISFSHIRLKQATEAYLAGQLLLLLLTASLCSLGLFLLE